MRRAVTAEEMRRADRFTIESGITEKQLVERAGTAVAEIIMQRCFPCQALVLLGRGNNGKDGEVIAKTLFFNGYKVTLFRPEEQFPRGDFDIIIDCLFGTGLSRDIDGKLKDVLNKINGMSGYKIACDIPSGINSDNGNVMGVAFRADLTVVIQEYKRGNVMSDGLDYCGETVVADIGIAFPEEPEAYFPEESDVKKIFAPRRRNSNKGTYGKACIIGGSKKYSGAALLSASALAAMKVGVGYSALAVPKSLYNVYAGRVPECLLLTLNDNGDYIVFDKNGLDALLSYDSIAVGMGLTVSEDAYKTVQYLIDNYKGNLIIDADGINSLAAYGSNVFEKKSCNILITPHVMEFSRISGLPKEQILCDQNGVAKDFAKRYGIAVLLKNSADTITDGNKVVINTVGTSGQAKAGSGDVLSGVIAGLAAGNGLFESAVCGSYIAGAAAVLTERQLTDYAMTATDVINNLNATVARIARQK